MKDVLLLGSLYEEDRCLGSAAWLNYETFAKLRNLMKHAVLLVRVLCNPVAYESMKQSRFCLVAIIMLGFDQEPRVSSWTALTSNMQSAQCDGAAQIQTGRADAVHQHQQLPVALQLLIIVVIACTLSSSLR